MLPTPVLSVSGKGFARLRISAWHFSPAPPILYAVRAIVYHKSRVLSRVLRDFSGSEAPGTPRLNRRRHLLSLPLWCSQGAEPQRHWLSLPRGRGPSQTPPSLATDSSISPGPPSPWLPALFTSAASQLPRHPWVPLTPAEPATPGASLPPGTWTAGRASAARVQSRGCKGRSPLHKKTLILPLPHRGRGLGDRGQKRR